MKYNKLINETGNLTNDGKDKFNLITQEVKLFLESIENLDKQKLLTLQSVFSKEISDILSNFPISQSIKVPEDKKELEKAKEIIKNYIDNY